MFSINGVIFLFLATLAFMAFGGEILLTVFAIFAIISVVAFVWGWAERFFK